MESFNFNSKSNASINVPKYEKNIKIFSRTQVVEKDDVDFLRHFISYIFYYYNNNYGNRA